MHKLTPRWACPAATLALISIWLGSAAQSVRADEEAKPPSAVEGRQLSEKFCKGCHIIGPEGAGTAQVGPPSFAYIANKPGQTAQHIIDVLVQPHPPMPDMHLTNEEIGNILAYLDTLRTDKNAPLLPPSGSGKLKYPSPS